MLTWKKPIAIVIVTAGVVVGSAFPQLTLGQTSVVSRNVFKQPGDTISDARPFESPYRKELPSIKPLPETTHRSAEPMALTPLPEQKLTPGMPIVIVQPPANAFAATNELTVDIEKINGSNDHEFAVRLRVPDSIKVIDVTPVGSSNSQRSFKIKMERQSNQPLEESSGQSVTSTYSMPIAAPIRWASSRNAVESKNQTQPSRQDSQLRQNPSAQPSPVRRGFQKNPFFQTEENTAKSSSQPLALVPKNSGPPVVLEVIEPPVISPTLDPSRAERASFNSAPIESSSEEAKGPASQLLFNTSLEPGEAIHSEIFGPGKMGLGDIGDFTIFVDNPTVTTIKNLTVRLDIPAGLEVVRLDREADFDESAATLTWQISNLTPAHEQFIRYRVKSLAEGSQRQRVWIGSGEEPDTGNEFETVVAVEFESGDYPLLPFESN